MWNQKQENCERLGLPLACLQAPQGDANLCIFLLHLPRGALEPLFLNYTRMYHAGKPETCWGLWAPHIVYVSP